MVEQDGHAHTIPVQVTTTAREVRKLEKLMGVCGGKGACLHASAACLAQVVEAIVSKGSYAASDEWSLVELLNDGSMERALGMSAAWTGSRPRVACFSQATAVACQPVLVLLVRRRRGVVGCSLIALAWPGGAPHAH